MNNIPADEAEGKAWALLGDDFTNERRRIARGTYAVMMKDHGLWSIDEARSFERHGVLPDEIQNETIAYEPGG